MDTTITGTVTWKPDPESDDATEGLMMFSLLRETEGDEILCMSSMEFDRGGVKVCLGNKVTLCGAWVVDNATGSSEGFLFHKATVSPC
jgi:hypothetical protein